MRFDKADDLGGHGRLVRIGGARQMLAQQAADGGAVPGGVSARSGKPALPCRCGSFCPEIRLPRSFVNVN
jgi:hypothetical protein